MTTDNEHHDGFWDYLFEYFDGECPPARAAAIERWIRSDPEIAPRVELQRASWEKLKRAASPMGRAGTLASLRRLQARRDIIELTGVDPGAGVASLEMRRRGHQAGRGLFLRVARVAAVTLVVVGSALGIQRVVARGYGWGSLRVSQYAAARGERVHITLPDGSNVMLAPESKLTYTARQHGGPRVVDLVGRAYFEVVHDAAHPFSVHTGSTETDDVGTHFLVEAYPGDIGVRIAVAEGEVAVRVDSGDGVPALRLTRGETAVVRGGHVIAALGGGDAGDYATWNRGSYRLHDASLAQVVREMSRWYTLDVQIADSSLASQRLSVTVGDESADQLLATIARATSAQYVRHGTVVILRHQ